MAIPDRLKLRPVNKKLVQEMSVLCDAIERELESGGTADDLLQRWNAHARFQCHPHLFRNYWRSMSKKTLIYDTLNPKPTFDKDLVYSEALAVLIELSAASIPEKDHAYYLDWLEAQFPNANMSDLIYWPDEWFGNASLFRDANGAFKPEAELSADQTLAYAMAKSGRELPGAPKDVLLPFPIPGMK